MSPGDKATFSPRGLERPKHSRIMRVRTASYVLQGRMKVIFGAADVWHRYAFGVGLLEQSRRRWRHALSLLHQDNRMCCQSERRCSCRRMTSRDRCGGPRRPGLPLKQASSHCFEDCTGGARISHAIAANLRNNPNGRLICSFPAGNRLLPVW